MEPVIAKLAQQFELPLQSPILIFSLILFIILLAPLVWLLACRIPEFYGRYDRRVLLAALLHGVLFAVAAWELWRGRAERISARWWMFAAMIASVILVLIVELLNSAIEAVVDRISLERHHLSKRAKDVGSAAVLLSLLNVAVVWGCVLFGAN